MRIGILALAMNLTGAQDAAPDLVIRVNVNLVQVDATVTDSKGKAVTGLTSADFELLQDGKRQEITNFSYIHSGGAENGAAPSVVRSKAPAKAPPGIALKPSQVRRTIALVVDDLGLSFDSTIHVRESLRNFVDREMQPGDLVAVIRTSAGMGAFQQFTSDKRLLSAAIDRVRFNGLGRVGVSSFVPLGSEVQMSSRDAQEAYDRFSTLREQAISRGSLGALRFVLDGLRDLPGRKSLVLFSESLRLVSNNTPNQPALDLIERLTDAANRASVVIYSIDPRGVTTHGLTAEDNTRYATSATVAQLPMERSAEEFHSSDGLVRIAAATGGLFLHHTNDIGGAIRQVMEDAQGYYLIGYHPDSKTFEALAGAARFHKVTVRVKRAGLQVRTRGGFLGSPDSDRQNVAHTREAEIAHALASPFAAGGIHVRLTPIFTTSREAGPYIHAMLYMDAGDLQFTEEADGWRQALLDLVAVTYDDAGRAVDSSDRRYTVRAGNPLYENLLKQGLIYSIFLPVKKAGAFQMRVVVRDANSERVGSANQFLEVPNLSTGRLALSSIVLRDREDSATEAVEGQMMGSRSEGSMAVRVFAPGTSIHYRYQILNAHVDSRQRPELESQTRLFREGKEVYAGKFTPLEVDAPADPHLLSTGGSLKLSEKMPVGDYVLQIIVTDKLARDRNQTVSQWVDFEVK